MHVGCARDNVRLNMSGNAPYGRRHFARQSRFQFLLRDVDVHLDKLFLRSYALLVPATALGGISRLMPEYKTAEQTHITEPANELETFSIWL